MDIRDEIKLSKGDMLSDPDENKHRNKLHGVKAIDHVSSIKSKSKVTGKSNSPKSGWVPMSERVLSPQPVTQYNPIIGELRKESEKAAVVKENFVVSKSKVAAVVSEKSNVVKESVVKSIEKSTVVKERDVTSKVGKSNVSAVVSEKSAVDEKDNLKVSKVSGESNKAAVVAPVIEKVSVVTESDKETKPIVVADVKAPVVAVVESVVEKDNPKVTSKVSDESVKAPVVKESVKVPVVKKSVKASSVVTDKPSSVVADKVDVVVKKSVNASSVVADKPSIADKASDALKNKPTGKSKKPVVEILVLRLSKQEENPEFKAKVNVKRKMILSKEDDRKKKLKGKSKKDVYDSELETDVVDYSSDEADRKRKKLKIKAGLKRKRSGLDSSDYSELDTKSIKRLISKLEKKGNKKLTKKVKKEEFEEEIVSKKGKKKEKQLTPKEAAHEEYLSSFPSFHARTTPCSLFSAIKNSRVDILRFFTDIGFSFLHNVSIDHLPSKLGWFVVSKFKSHMLSFDSGDKNEVTPSKIHDMLGVPFGGYSLFDLDEREADNEFDLIKKDEEKLSLICAERVMLEDYMRKASLKCPGDGKFVALREKYVNLFKHPISFEDDGNGDNVGDDDDENGDDDGGNVDNDVNDCDGYGDEEDVNEGDKDPNGSNPSFGFSKISLEDFGNDSGLAEKDKVVEGNPTEQGTVVKGNQAEECEIMSTPENFTQWLEKIMDLVGEGDLFGDNSATLEAMNQEITPKKLPTQKASPSPQKRDVKPSSYPLSLYMNKKTNVVSKITRLEFILGNSLFAMQGDKIENVFEAHFGKFIVYGLAPGLWLDANVIDCWVTVLNHEESFRAAESKSKHFFQPVVFLTKTTAMTILDNSPKTYDSKYKEVYDLLYGHIRHTHVVKVKHTIPKLKWKTKEDFHDCGIFTMLHMENFNGGPALNLDCGLPVESQLHRDMLRRLRFKFVTKILLHEINVHTGKMLELAKEFDKTDPVEKMAIIVDAFKKREERDCI
uniref:Ulp1 protease family, C-terminal catalytic domain-containing protein n=1 Tax=Tanacetum cinerariifolium TaxID=118510 RepID=A0A6L2JNS6_TANCI|nr:hypothetical protein [Tanacetum cinerariifolium]